MTPKHTFDLQEGRSTIECVARFEHQVTGVTVSEDNRIFVNFPRWTEDTAVSVAELLADGSVKPYPDEEWNAWRNARKDEVTPEDHWVCVQSVVADGRGSLWVLDPAAPAQSHMVDGGPKLVRIDLATNTVKQTIAFGEDTAPQGSYLNDVRFSPEGDFAYITDSGVKGALLVVEIAAGRAVRVLDGDESTQMKKGLDVKADGKDQTTESTCTGRRSRATPCTASRPSSCAAPACAAKTYQARSRNTAPTASTTAS